jgi:hypothetical protein
MAAEVRMVSGRGSTDRYLDDALGAAAPPAPVVDFSGVRHLGAVGVAQLLSYHRRCRLTDIPLRVDADDGPVAGVLSIAPGLHIYRRIPDALAAVAARDEPSAHAQHTRERPDGS